MISFYGGLTASIVVLTLFIGVGAHAARPAALGEALRAHGVLGPRLRRFAAVVVPFAEGALGVGGAAALLTGHQRGLQAVLALGTALFGLYAGYTRHVLALGRGGPCGCSHQDLPLSRWVTRRAVALAGLALAGAVLAGAGPVQLSAAELVTLLLAAPACTVLLWSLPAAMHDPAAASVPLTARAAVHQPTETTVHRTAEGVSTRWTSPPAL
ncbi:MauE/DoxX family redox-associated membrane protein [Streptomyces niveus]|uniref:MauE/DoxX family redox-associated membrane protein n=1 Tax=Streptomyces niveus TaxID=193462 RepID=UPI0035E0378D